MSEGAAEKYCRINVEEKKVSSVSFFQKESGLFSTKGSLSQVFVTDCNDKNLTYSEGRAVTQ